MHDEEISRLSRLTSMLTLLQSKKLVTARFIAQKFGVSTRTIYRDIRALESAGVPIYTEEGKGYALLETYRMTPVMLTEAEVNALITAEQMVLKNRDRSFVEDYSSAITKIKARLTGQTRDKAEKLSGLVAFRQNLAGETTSNYLSLIQRAITNFNPLKISYQAEGQEDLSFREIEPMAVYSTNENWIVIAFCRLRDEVRSFRLDRIQEAVVLPGKFKSHDFDFAAYYAYYRKKFYGDL